MRFQASLTNCAKVYASVLPGNVDADWARLQPCHVTMTPSLLRYCLKAMVASSSINQQCNKLQKALKNFLTQVVFRFWLLKRACKRGVLSPAYLQYICSKTFGD